MGLIKRGNSKFWYIQFQMDGQTHIKSTRTTDKRLAEAMESQYRTQVIRNEHLGIKDRIKLSEAFEIFQRSKSANRSVTNIKRYFVIITKNLKSVSYIDQMADRDLELLKVRLESDGYSNQTIKHTMNALRGTVKYAKRLGYRIPDLEFPTIPVSLGRIRYLSVEEERDLLESLDPYREIRGLASYAERHGLLKKELHDQYDFVIMLLDTGARYSEIATLEWKAICFEDRSIQLWRSKVQNESILYMTDRVYEVLQRRFNEKTSRYVFTNRSGGAKQYNSKTLSKAFQRAGIEGATAHTLRHTHASRLIQNGLNLYEIKEVLGHSDIKTTMRYAHLEQAAVSLKVKEVMNKLNKSTSHTGTDTTFGIDNPRSAVKAA